MGLVIGITACCCAYCAIKKKKQRKRKRLEKNQDAEEANDYDTDAEIPVGQNIIPDYVDDGTDDELNVDYPLQPDGQHVGMDNDRPPPPSYHAPSVPKGAVLEEMDETGNLGGRKHSSKKVKYSHLADSETAKVVDSTDPAPKTSKSDDENKSAEVVTVVNDGETFMKEVVDKMAGIEEEGSFEGGGKKQSSKKYKYSPLKGSESERKRVKSGDSHKEHHHEDIRMSWSNDIYIDEPPTEV